MGTMKTAAERRQTRGRAAPSPDKSSSKASSEVTKSHSSKKDEATAVTKRKLRERKVALDAIPLPKAPGHPSKSAQTGEKASKASSNMEVKKAGKKATSKQVNGGNADNEEYEIERVVDTKVKDGKRLFLVRWKGYKKSANTWEPEEHLLNAQIAMDHYKMTNLRKLEEEELEKKGADSELPVPKKQKKSAKASRATEAVAVVSQDEEDEDTME